MKKFEFSKLIVVIVGVFVLGIISISFTLMFKLGDLTSLSEIVIGSFAVLTATLSYYFWKSKNENLVKIMNQLPQEQREVIENELENEFIENVSKDDFASN